MPVKKKISLSVIVPAFNEEKTIAHVLKALLKQSIVSEVIVVDDCSRDATAKAVQKIKDRRVRLFCHEKNQGKGKAIQTGLSHVTGTYTLIQDADMEYDPAEIPHLMNPILTNKAEVVFGSRFTGSHTNMFYWHYVGNKALNFIVNILYNTTLSDMETCYKIVPTAFMKKMKLKENDFRIEPEITCKLLKLGVKIFEIPISYVGRTYEDGKKITWRDGFFAVWTIITLIFWRPNT